MAFISGILFLIVSIIAFSIFAKKLLAIKRNIQLGRPVDLNDQPLARWKNVFLLAFGQKKMFKNVVSHRIQDAIHPMNFPQSATNGQFRR